jgi:hypothetical protein
MTTTQQAIEQIKTFAKHGPDSCEAIARRHNTAIPEIEERARRRDEEREAYARTVGESLFQGWLASKRTEFEAAARAQFDAKSPPIEVPERIEIADARAMASTKKGKAAA